MKIKAFRSVESGFVLAKNQILRTAASTRSPRAGKFPAKPHPVSSPILNRVHNKSSRRSETRSATFHTLPILKLRQAYFHAEVVPVAKMRRGRLQANTSGSAELHSPCLIVLSLLVPKIKGCFRATALRFLDKEKMAWQTFFPNWDCSLNWEAERESTREGGKTLVRGGAVKLVGKDMLARFSAAHPDAKSALDSWISEAEEAKWQNFQEIKHRYATASYVAKNRVVFNVKGNHYRLDVKIDLRNQILIVKRIGTHAEYDDWTY